MRITRVSPVSVAKVAFVLYAVLGLIIGGVIACAALLGATFGPHTGDGSAVFGVIFGAGAVIFMPLLYGGFGALGALIGSAIYNLVAGFVGGIEVTLEPITQAR
jgi:hypothetical protein